MVEVFRKLKRLLNIGVHGTINLWMDGDGKIHKNPTEPKLNGKFGVNLIVDLETGEVLMAQPYIPLIISAIGEEPHLEDIKHPDIPGYIDLSILNTLH